MSFNSNGGRSWNGIVALSVASFAFAQAASASGVSVQDTSDQYVLTNEHIALTINKKSAEILSLKQIDVSPTRELGNGKQALYFDANAGVDIEPAGLTPVKKGYHRIGGDITEARVIHNDPNEAEVVFSAKPSAFYPFQVDVHYLLFAGEHGYYAYAAYHRPPGLPAGTLFQTRFVAKTNIADIFDQYVVDETRISDVPKGKVTKVLADATFELDNGDVKTKYMQSVYWSDHLAYGMTGKNMGLWMITPSPEFFNGGPIKQGQTVHDDNILRVMQSVHFGASALHFDKDETWDKIYGPVFVYLNSGPSTEAMLADAERQQQQEFAHWPYKWVTDSSYHKQRGTVTGKLVLTTGAAAKNAEVILAAPGGNWPAQGKSYIFSVKTDDNGHFSISKVIPGNYTLYATGADQPEDFSHDGVTVTANKTTEINNLQWKPITHGKTLWQIGTFDRTAGEFRNGDDARHFQVFSRYPAQFPDDVTYTVGQSDIRKDWNYAQWTFYSKKPVWTIRFQLDKLPTSPSTLTLGFASSQPMTGNETNLLVAVNGTQVDNIHLPKTGTAGYRGGVQDSQYNVRYLTIAPSLLKTGWNEITLGHQDAKPFPTNGDVETGPIGQGIGQVMYDAIRFEVQK